MISGTLIETSIFVSLVEKSGRWYCCVERWLDETYRDSQIYETIKKICDRVRTYFRYSFLGKITEPKEKDNFAILEGNVVIQRTINSYKKWMHKFISYFKSSKTDNLIGQFKKDFYFSPIKTIGIIIIGAIITNIIFCILFKKQIELFGWFMRGLLFFIGLNGLYCNITWEEISKTSYFLKLLNNSCKI